MEQSVASGPASETDVSSASALPRVRVRYWGAARAAAGRHDDIVSAATVADALVAVGSLAHDDPARFDKVLSVCSFLLAETPVGLRDLGAVATADGDTLDVLPPFAGG